MFRAIAAGEIRKAEELVEAGAELTVKGHCGQTALMAACESDQVEMLRWLIARGASVHETDDFGNTAIILAAEHGAYRCVGALIEARAKIDHDSNSRRRAITSARTIETIDVLVGAGADINHINGEGYSLLMYAAERGDVAFAQALLERGANPDATSTGETALHKAVAFEKRELVELLLKHRANPNAQDVDGYSPLCLAKCEEIMAILLKAGADPALKDSMGETPVDALLRRGNEKLGQRLFAEQGAKNPDFAGSPLHAAAFLRNLDLMSRFLREKIAADVLDREGYTPLHWLAAASPSHKHANLSLEILRAWAESRKIGVDFSGEPAAPKAAIELLLKHGARLEALSHAGETPLLAALQWEQEEIGLELIGQGADVNGRDETGWSPVILAAAAGRLKIMELLLGKGASLRVVRSGWSALNYASHHGKIEMVRYLIGKGMDANAEYGKTRLSRPLHSAVFMGHLEIVKILLDHGADPHSADGEGRDSITIAESRMAEPGVAKERPFGEILRLLGDHPPS